MPLYKKERSYSETGTSVEQGIMVSQKGIVTFVAKSGRVLGIPCHIPVPTNLMFTPMTQLGASALSTTGGWSTDLVLYKASDVYNSFASIASAVTLAEVGFRLRMSSDYKLYVANASQAATTGASNSRLASNSLWKLQESYGINQKKYLKVNINNAASGAFKGKRLKLAYEIKGYEY